jgi:hypothetical protein
MNAKKTKVKLLKAKSLYAVVGYATTGSGTLTYPEDFDFVGVFQSSGAAQKCADQKNKEVIEENEIEYDDDDCLEEALMSCGAMCYDVVALPFMG